MDEYDEETVFIDEEVQTSQNEKAAAAELTKGLGTWIFDTRSKKRKYISLSGRVLTGVDATHISNMDKESENHPERSARNDLTYLVNHFFEPTLEFARNGPTTATSEHFTLQYWGLPEVLVNHYKAMKGVERLFEWQVEALCKISVLNGGNLIYSAPTSGGKTLVAEILMLRRLARVPKGTIFYVVPFVSLCEEKVEYFQDMWSSMHIGVRPFHGDDGGSTLTSDIDVVVCTIERANILLNTLLDEKRENELSMVIVDEIHMLSDDSRGFLLEVLLSKIHFLLRGRVQILGALT